MDGTSTTRIIRDIAPGSASSINSLNGVALDNEKFLFNANGQLWVSDGTEINTIRIGPEDATLNPHTFVSLGNKALFILDNTITVSDGTEIGTHSLIFSDGSIAAGGSILKVSENIAYISFGENLLYTTDGISLTKVVVNVADNTGNVDATGPNITKLGTSSNSTFYINTDVTSGTELWVSDDNSFHIVKDILVGSGSALAGLDTSQTIIVGDKIIFPAYINANTRALFISDGSEQGTIKISNEVPTNKFLLNDTLIFSNNTGVHAINTSLVTPVVQDLIVNSVNKDFQNDLDQVFFQTSNGDFFATTGQNTTKLGVNITQFKVFAENVIYFTVQDTVQDLSLLSLWYSDGTLNGTHFVSYVDGLTLENSVVIHTVGYPQ
jgi:hypothetical protein